MRAKKIQGPPASSGSNGSRMPGVQKRRANQNSEVPGRLRKARQGLIGQRSGEAACAVSGQGELRRDPGEPAHRAAHQLARTHELETPPLSFAHWASQSCPAREPEPRDGPLPTPVRPIPLAAVGSVPSAISPDSSTSITFGPGKRASIDDRKPGVCSGRQGYPMSKAAAGMTCPVVKVLRNTVTATHNPDL